MRVSCIFCCILDKLMLIPHSFFLDFHQYPSVSSISENGYFRFHKKYPFSDIFCKIQIFLCYFCDDTPVISGNGYFYLNINAFVYRYFTHRSFCFYSKFLPQFYKELCSIEVCWCLDVEEQKFAH